MTETIEPTPEDYAAVHRSLENPRQQFIDTLARLEARQRVERERRERRRRSFLRRLLSRDAP